MGSGWQAIGRRRARTLAVAVLAVAALLVPASASAQSAELPSVFFKVVYQGSGQYTVDGSASCNTNSSCFNGPIHQNLTFDNWSATFPAVELGPGGGSGTASAAQQQISAHFEGTDTDCDDISTGDCHNQDCFATYASDPGAPPIALDGSAAGGSLNLRIEAPWHPMPTSFTCFPIAMPGPPFPDLIRAVTTVSLDALSHGPVTRPVSSGDPGVYQLPADCTAEAHADNSDVTSCTRSSNWSGTVTITPDCVTGNGSDAPWCIKKKTKDDAQKAANDDNATYQYQTNLADQLGCTAGAGTVNADPETKLACAGRNLMRGTYKGLALTEQQIANDPPDLNFAAVPQPAAVHLAGLRAIQRRAPNFARLAQNYATASALMQALVTAENRATGAFQAMTGGNQAAAASLRAQNAAVLSYATKAARIFRGQPAVMRKAVAELRRVGPHARVLAAALLRPKAVQADRLAAAALLGIGH